MAKIYLIRHGESVANTEGRYQGQSYDTPLSLLGEAQAAALGRHLAPVKFTQIFASPLTRTLQTAQAISKNFTLVNEILETNHGLWEGKTKSEIQLCWPELYAQWLKSPKDVIFPSGEAFRQTAARAVSWLEALSTKPGDFAVVTHSNIIFVILCHYLGRDLNDMWQFEVQPTCISLLESRADGTKITYSNLPEESINRATFHVVSYNDISHLKGLESDLSKHAI